MLCDVSFSFLWIRTISFKYTPFKRTLARTSTSHNEISHSIHNRLCFLFCLFLHHRPYIITYLNHVGFEKETTAQDTNERTNKQTNERREKRTATDIKNSGQNVVANDVKLCNNIANFDTNQSCVRF